MFYNYYSEAERNQKEVKTLSDLNERKKKKRTIEKIREYVMKICVCCQGKLHISSVCLQSSVLI